MKANVGGIDKVIRLIIGIALIVVLGFVMKSWWGLIGIIPIMTAIFSRCGFYYPLGINTCKKKDDQKV
jgi:hypothetical protein